MGYWLCFFILALGTLAEIILYKSVYNISHTVMKNTGLVTIYMHVCIITYFLNFNLVCLKSWPLMGSHLAIQE